MASLTKDQLQGMIQEVVGHSMQEIQAKRDEEVTDLKKQLDYVRSHAKPQTDVSDEERGLKAAQFIKCLAAAKGHTGMAADMAKSKGYDASVSKALGEATLAGGGALVAPDFAEEFIDFLRARTVVRDMGARTVPMPRGQLTIPRVGQGSQAAYVGESANIAENCPAFEQLVLTAKKLAVLCAVSNELLQDSSVEADTLIRDDLVQASSVRQDAAFIRDDGTQNRPKGMLHWAANNRAETNAAATPNGSTTAEIIEDLGTCIQVLMDGNIPMSRVGWLMAPRTWRRLFTELDANSNHVFKDELAAGTLMGFPFAISTQIPTNLGSGSDESELYLADFASLMIGETKSLEVAVSDSAAYHDGAQVQSAFSRDESTIRVIQRHDFAPRYSGQEISVLSGLTWGA